ncbi:M14 family metallopeptidase [Allokutzneria sp. NRRL B-24872]|uniref:M14 family metallopeptidase n=1 Tax=Allokutzneria sp. NRRL B-24872 TaxID=1137961 RepID=UPI001FEDF3DE|nr:M14 family metallopeptidase [Allokutzneria sp. NRRL B-24872]
MATRLGLRAVAVGACLAVIVPTYGLANMPEAETVYTVDGVSGTDARTEVVSSGADVLGVDHAEMTVSALPGEAKLLRDKGFKLTPVGDRARQLAERSGPDVVARDFPPADAGYHNYTELTEELRKTERDFPGLAKLSSVGKSHEGRDVWLMKLSTNVGTDENEPETIFTCNQHAREHLSAEMCLRRVVQRFTTGYATDPAVKKFMDSREIWVLPMVNPDGIEYDVSTGTYKSWRLNRQPNAGSSRIGTDLNRNWGHKWGCCGGSSSSPGSETYRGANPFSAPETKVVSDFVNSRVIGGKQQITTHIDFHTYGELVMWPYGYTKDDTTPDLNSENLRAFKELGTQMATSNRYKPQQASDLYITDGGVRDWMWGQHKIWSYTFEMFGGQHGFYPPDEVIDRETSRNDKAVDLMLTYADCVPRVVGGSCG